VRVIFCGPKSLSLILQLLISIGNISKRIDSQSSDFTTVSLASIGFNECKLRNRLSFGLILVLASELFRSSISLLFKYRLGGLLNKKKNLDPNKISYLLICNNDFCHRCQGRFQMLKDERVNSIVITDRFIDDVIISFLRDEQFFEFNLQTMI